MRATSSEELMNNFLGGPYMDELRKMLNGKGLQVAVGLIYGLFGIAVPVVMTMIYEEIVWWEPGQWFIWSLMTVAINRLVDCFIVRLNTEWNVAWRKLVAMLIVITLNANMVFIALGVYNYIRI